VKVHKKRNIKIKKMTERIYIQEMQKELQYKDRRSVRRWCFNNDVRILSDNGSNKQYTLKDEFESAISKHYKKRSENNKSAIIINTKNRNKMVEYTPQGEYDKQFLSIFTNTLTTL